MNLIFLIMTVTDESVKNLALQRRGHKDGLYESDEPKTCIKSVHYFEQRPDSKISNLIFIYIVFITLQNHNNFKVPVTLSILCSSAGPMATTVFDPAAICVRPASCMSCATKP